MPENVRGGGGVSLADGERLHQVEYMDNINVSRHKKTQHE